MKLVTHRTVRSISIITGIIATCIVYFTTLHSQKEPEYVPDELLVKFIETASPSNIHASKQAVKGEHVKTFPGIGVQHWRLGNGITVEKALEILSKTPFKDKIEYAEPNYIFHTFSIPNDPLRGELWGMHNIGQTSGTPDADIDALEAWQTATGSGDVVVGDIDTGIDYLHEDLSGNIWSNTGEMGPDGNGGDKSTNGVDDDNNGYIDDWRGWDFVNNDNDPMDDHNHGTHTSGTIGAKGNNGKGVAGVCWNVKLMPLKFLNSGGWGTTDNAIKAIQYASMFSVRITSNSWGGGNKSKSLENAIKNSGALFVAAAGNSGSSVKMYPAAYSLDNVISVAATDRNDALASFSNYGTTWVDLAAPGVSVLSTVRNNEYRFFSGTSMATPHVAGVAALLLDQNPGWTNAQIKSRILSTVDPLPSLAGKVATGGRLNARAAVGAQEFLSDAIAPDAVTLFAGSPTDNSITLTWTAVGDDGNTGTAYAYDIRYLAGTQITASNWSTAIQVSGEPLPQPSGSPETFTVSNLAGSTTYYFAIKVMDKMGNISVLLNSPSATTLLPLWATEVVDNVGSVGFYKSLAYDASGNQSISYSDDTNDEVEFARWNGSSWTLETVDAAGGSSGIDLAYNTSGNPTLSYGWGKLKFAQKSGSTWTITTIETKNANNDYTSLVYSPIGEATIAYRITSPPANASGLKLAKRNPSTGVWTKEMVDQQAGARYNSLAFDGTGKPAIAYSDDIDRDNWLESLKFARWNGTSWNIQVIETGTVGYGVFASLAFDPTTGNPAIAHGNAGQVRFLMWNGTSWILEIIDCCVSYGGYSLGFDVAGTAFLCYAKSGSPATLQFSKRVAPNTWTSETVDRGSISSFRNSMKFKSGIPAVAYRNAGIKFAQRTSVPFAPTGDVNILSKAGEGEQLTVRDASEAARIAALMNINIPNAPMREAMESASKSIVMNAVLPDQIKLEGNYPNPFNPTTTISFTLLLDGVVRLQVFDALGRIVGMLQNEHKNAGRYEVTFDAENLPSGVYYYRIEAGGQTRTGRMMLMK